MSQTKRISKGKRAVSVVGVAGMSLAVVDGGASAAINGSATDIQSPNMARQLVPFGEEELSDVSLSAFYIFDKENAKSSRLGIQEARGCGGCGGRGCGGCRGCGGRGCGGRGCGGFRGCGGCGGCGFGWGGCGCCLSWGSCRWC